MESLWTLDKRKGKCLQVLLVLLGLLVGAAWALNAAAPEARPSGPAPGVIADTARQAG